MTALTWSDRADGVAVRTWSDRADGVARWRGDRAGLMIASVE
ncbi:hypothetical protein [Streptomyces sp. SP18CS02]|nr:hypothetical protein [Streptomyces sp. SP18CS02]MEE1756833.1 hypothetical protein [Streptomyces sp. SP18CS02]